MSKELVKLESRAHQQNIWIFCVLEDDSASSSTASVTTLLMEAFTLEKQPVVDRAHWALIP